MLEKAGEKYGVSLPFPACAGRLTGRAAYKRANALDDALMAVDQIA